MLSTEHQAQGQARVTHTHGVTAVTPAINRKQRLDTERRDAQVKCQITR